MEEHILLFMKIVNTKLPLLRPGLELNILHLINAMSGIKQKLTLMEQIKPSVNLTGQDPLMISSTLMNIFSSFISNKIIKFNGQGHPWFGKKIKAKIALKNRVYRNTLKWCFLFTAEFDKWNFFLSLKMQK